MAVVAAREAPSSSLRHGLPASFKRDGTVYSIAFDMDIEQLRVHYGDPYDNAYLEIRRVLERHPDDLQVFVHDGGPCPQLQPRPR